MSESVDVNSQEFKDALAAAVSEATEGLKAKNTELLGKIKKLQQGQQIDPADLEAVERERDDLRKQLGEAQKVAKKATADAEAATKRANDIDSAYSNTLRDSALSEALAKNGVTDPVLQKAAKSLLREGVNVVDENGTRVVKAGEHALDRHITEWAGSDEGKRFVSAPDTTGGGSHGGRGANHQSAKGDLGGSRDERTAAIASRFPDLPK